MEAKLEPGLKARWQFLHNGIEQDIDIKTEKYGGSKLLPNLTLIISNAVFEDEGSYRLQVLIQDGWCSSTPVELRKVRGSKFRCWKYPYVKISYNPDQASHYDILNILTPLNIYISFRIW